MGWFRRKKSGEGAAAIGLSTMITNTNAMPVRDEELAELALDLIEDGVIIVDAAEMTKLVNPAALMMTGVVAEVALGVSLRGILKIESLAGEAVDEAVNPIFLAIRRGEHYETKDYAVITANSGRRVPVLIKVVPTPQEMGRTIITLKNIEQELKEDSAQMEFISTASHEMRTPVASIEGYLGLAINPSTATIDERARKYLESAQAASKHLGKLFQDLLDVTKLEERKMPKRLQPLELTALTAQIMQMHLPAIGAKSLRVRLGEEAAGTAKLSQSIFVHIDPDFWREIINNLVENAIKYTPAGGEIKIKVIGEGDRAVVTVTDSGIGIAGEDIGRIFQKFYRVDNSDTRTIGGTGLGLYLVKQRVESMGGRITVESMLGRGTTFKVVLPRLSEVDYQRLLVIWRNQAAAVQEG